MQCVHIYVQRYKKTGIQLCTCRELVWGNVHDVTIKEIETITINQANSDNIEHF